MIGKLKMNNDGVFNDGDALITCLEKKTHSNTCGRRGSRCQPCPCALHVR
jgi:hypothetical protein